MSTLWVDTCGECIGISALFGAYILSSVEQVVLQQADATEPAIAHLVPIVSFGKSLSFQPRNQLLSYIANKHNNVYTASQCHAFPTHFHP